MEQQKKSKASSGGKMDTSNVTEDESDVKGIMKSVVEDHMTMFELNKKFEEFDMDRLKRETMEIVESQTFSESQTHIETTYLHEIERMKSDINKQLDKQAISKERVKTLEDTIQIKETEIAELKEKHSKFEEKLQKKNREIEDLDTSNTDLHNQVDQLKKANKHIENKYKEACTDQKQAQRECDFLKAEKSMLEKTFQAEKNMLSEKLSNIKTVHKSFIEKNSNELDNKIQTIETMHKKRLEEMKIETEKSYEHQIRQSKRETDTMKSERDLLKQQVNEQEMEFEALKKAHNKLKEEIFKYNILLEKKMETYSTVNKELIEQTKVVHEQKETTLMISSNIEKSKASVSDLKPTPLSINVDPTGNCLTIHNSSKEIDIFGWMIERTLPNGEKRQFKINEDIKLGAKKDLKIWSTPGPDKKGPGDIVATFSTWGTGKGEIKVKDKNEKIIHI